MMTKRKPHDLLFRDAPDERDLSVMRQFQTYLSISIALMSMVFTDLISPVTEAEV